MKLKLDKLNTLSNYLSILRFVLTIPLFFLMDDLEGNRTIIIITLFVIALTDFLDGYFARKFNETTEYGKILDPLADKIAMAVIIVKLYITGHVPNFLFWMIILRDVLIFLGGIIVSRKLGKVLPSNLLGKATVCILGFYILAIVFGAGEDTMINKVLLIMSVIFIILSFAAYVLRAVESIKWNKNETL